MSRDGFLSFRLAPTVVLACALVFAFAARGVAYALPPAGTDTLNVTGQVSISSRTGQETIMLNGTATVQRAAPHSKGSVDAIDAEITSMSLTGSSLTGPVTVAESATQVSNGEIRSMSGGSFPATSFFNIYAIVMVPASPNPTITLHNDATTPLVFSDASVAYWPPYNTVYVASPSPCILLQPAIQNPAQICISSATMTLTTPGVGGLTELSVPRNGGERAQRSTPNDHAFGIGIVLALFVTFGVVANFARTRVRPHR